MTVLLALAALAAGPVPARSGTGDFAQLRVKVRFGNRGGDAVRLRARFDPGTGRRSWHPGADGLRIGLGPAVLLDLEPGVEGAARRTGSGCWRIGSWDGSGPTVRLRFDPGRGELALSADRTDLDALRAEGPGGVELFLGFGGEERRAVMDFREATARRWEFRSTRERPGGGDGGGGGGETIPHEVLATGSTSGIDEERAEVVTDRRSWEALWEDHAPGEPAPEVDFDAESVLAVFLGSRPNSGYGVRILSVTKEEDSLAVAWEESVPGEDCVTAQVITTPFVFVTVERPGATATFEGSAVVYDCR